MMNKFFLPFLSQSINRYLDLDPDSRQRVQQLQGKVITIEFLPFHLLFQCEFNDGIVVLHQDDILPADTTIRGTPLQLMGVMVTKKNRQSFFTDDIRMEGDAELGQQVIELFDEIQIDWEEHASRFIGDVPAYHTSRILGKFKSWLSNTKENMTDDIASYLHEETNWQPAREALSDFFSDIDAIRLDVDRAEARIKNIEAIIKDNEKTP